MLAAGISEYSLGGHRRLLRPQRLNRVHFAARAAGTAEAITAAARMVNAEATNAARRADESP